MAIPPPLPKKQYFVHLNGAQYNATAEEIRNWRATGAIPPDTLVWKEGLPDWVQIGSLPEFSVVPPPPPSATPPKASMKSGTAPATGGIVIFQIAGLILGSIVLRLLLAVGIEVGGGSINNNSAVQDKQQQNYGLAECERLKSIVCRKQSEDCASITAGINEVKAQAGTTLDAVKFRAMCSATLSDLDNTAQMGGYKNAEDLLEHLARQAQGGGGL